MRPPWRISRTFSLRAILCLTAVVAVLMGGIAIELSGTARETAISKQLSAAGAEVRYGVSLFGCCISGERAKSSNTDILDNVARIVYVGIPASGMNPEVADLLMRCDRLRTLSIRGVTTSAALSEASRVPSLEELMIHSLILDEQSCKALTEFKQVDKIVIVRFPRSVNEQVYSDKISMLVPWAQVTRLSQGITF
jgi:hypothetical protein